MTALVRPATDPAQVARIHARCFTEPWDMAATLATPGSFALVTGDKGFVLCRAAADECEILSIGVVAESRGQGLGARLLAAAIDAARTRGAARLFLEVAEDNAAARALYDRAGFALVARRTGYYAAGTDALVLTLELHTKLR